MQLKQSKYLEKTISQIRSKLIKGLNEVDKASFVYLESSEITGISTDISGQTAKISFNIEIRIPKEEQCN